LPELSAEIERLSLVIEIGGMPVRVNTADAGFLAILQDRYSGFVSESERAEIEFDVEITTSSLVIDGKKFLYNSSRDITERKRAEADRLSMERALRASAKHQSLEVMAAGVAHTFNNQLQTVIANLEVAREEAPASLAAPLADAIAAARKAAEVSGVMRTYLGQGLARRTPHALGRELHGLIGLLRTQLPNGVRLDVEAAEDGPICDVDPREFRQIIMSLATNAWEAIPRGGTGGSVSISARLVPGPRPAEFLACVEVRDTGIGMEPATVERAFDPFFTTKFAGRGLGLAAVHGMVESMKGTISIASQLGVGTTVTLLLPARAPVAIPSAGPLPPAPVSFSERWPGVVLVIDDEPMVIAAIQRLLHRSDAQVLSATSGADALAVFDGRQGRVDCVFLDLQMPGMDGWETLAALRERRPDVYVVVASGLDLEELRAREQPIRPDGWLQKPFTREQLLSVLPPLSGPTPLLRLVKTP